MCRCEVGAVGREGLHLGAGGVDGIAGRPGPVGPEGVQHDDVSRPQRGAEDRLDVGHEDVGGGATFESHHGVQAMRERQGADHRDHVAAVPWCLCVAALASLRAAVQSCHRSV